MTQAIQIKTLTDEEALIFEVFVEAVHSVGLDAIRAYGFFGLRPRNTAESKLAA